MEIGLDPSNSVIKRLRCTIKSTIAFVKFCNTSHILTERLCQTEDMFLHQKSMYMETSTKNAGLIATKQHLEEVMKEKTKRIEE